MTRTQLETDAALLVPKAQAALERYGHQVVIGNDLQTRKWEVVFVSQAQPRSQSEPQAQTQTQSQSQVESGDAYEAAWLRIDPALTTPGAGAGGMELKEIEEDIVRELEARHGRWIERG